jgi:hypothetical protein
MGAGVAPQCSRNRCLARWIIPIPRRGRGGAAGRAKLEERPGHGPDPRFLCPTGYDGPLLALPEEAAHLQRRGHDHLRGGAARRGQESRPERSGQSPDEGYGTPTRSLSLSGGGDMPTKSSEAVNDLRHHDELLLSGESTSSGTTVLAPFLSVQLRCFLPPTAAPRPSAFPRTSSEGPEPSVARRFGVWVRPTLRPGRRPSHVLDLPLASLRLVEQVFTRQVT